MNKYIIILLCLCSCVSDVDFINYPLKNVKLDNFNKIDFKYKKIKNIEYEFCRNCWITNTCYGNNSDNLINRSVRKFLSKNELKPNQYLINFNYESRIYWTYFMSDHHCTKVTMELVEKVDE